MQNRSFTTPLLSLAIAWLLLVPMLVFASEYGFSFEGAPSNSEVGAAEAGVATGGNSGSSVVRIQNLAVYAICAGVTVSALNVIVAGFWSDLLLSALVILAFASSLWSQDPHGSFVTSIYLTLNIALAFYLLQRFSPENLMKLFMLVGACAVVGTLVLVVAFPQYGLQFRGGSAAHGAWEGIFRQKNICGEALVYLLTPAFFVRLSGRYGPILRIAYIVSLLFVIAMTRSVGAWAMCIGTLFAIVVIRKLARARGTDAAVLVLCGCLVLFAVSLLAIRNADTLLYLVGKDPTLTDRTVIWAHLLTSVLKRPLLGFGYMAFWGGLHGESANIAIALDWPGISYAENGLLELCLSLGLVGVFLFLLLFARAVRDGIYCYRRNATPEVMWLITILVFTLFANIEAGKLLYPSDLECILQYIAFIGLRQQRLRIQQTSLREPVAA